MPNLDLVDIIRGLIMIAPFLIGIVSIIMSVSHPAFEDFVIILSILYVSSLVQKTLTMMKIGSSTKIDMMSIAVIFISMIPLMLMLWVFYLRKDFQLKDETECRLDKSFPLFFTFYSIESLVIFVLFFLTEKFNDQQKEKHIKMISIGIIILTVILQLVMYVFTRVDSMADDCFVVKE